MVLHSLKSKLHQSLGVGGELQKSCLLRPCHSARVALAHAAKSLNSLDPPRGAEALLIGVGGVGGWDRGMSSRSVGTGDVGCGSV